MSETPKLSPVTVTELPPLTALFNSPYETTAASKLSDALAVPTMLPTLTADTPQTVLAALPRHASAVAEIHDDLSHTTVSKTAVPLRSTEPKLSPLTVTELPPLNGPFCTQPDPTAASKLYAALAVPATPPTLTADMPVVLNLVSCGTHVPVARSTTHPRCETAQEPQLLTHPLTAQLPETQV